MKNSDQSPRFEFGKNWSHFLEGVGESHIERSSIGLLNLLGDSGALAGKTFLDIGSGSGLSSLAARRLGASVRSFDYDRQSVAATRELKQRFAPDDEHWTIEVGSILDQGYLASLGQWDVVYSWGVLHHTGAMWSAMENFPRLVKPGGRAALAIYNDQGYISERWKRIKRTYSRHSWSRPMLLGLGAISIWGWQSLLDAKNLRPFASWQAYGRERGMSPWYDLVDWVGGFPFEVAKPEEIFRFFRERGFHLETLLTNQGRGCNEFCFSLDV